MVFKAFIRTDASVEIGAGHVMRCLTLADVLKTNGARCSFICHDYEGHLFDEILRRGYEVCVLSSRETKTNPHDLEVNKSGGRKSSLGLDWKFDAFESKRCIGSAKADLVVVDHYNLGAGWESELRGSCKKIMVIDDLANRVHNCDILLDQNYYVNMDERYVNLVPEKCIVLLGPNYVLLRPEFEEAKKRVRQRDGSVKRIMVFFGGSDPTMQTAKVIGALNMLNISGILVDVVVGQNNPNKIWINNICSLSNFKFHCNISNMAELALNADLGIGAGGSATWERCYLGLPTITVAVAENQVRTSKDLAQLGAISYLGWHDEIESGDYLFEIQRLIDNPQQLRHITDAALKIIDNRSMDLLVRCLIN